MSDIAIRIDGLGKQFRIGAAERYRTLRDTLNDTLTAPFRFLRNLSGSGASGKAPAETFWALKDVSFEVKHGDVIGIIGRNGAGKSTLLKILSRITEPTEGYAEIRGRVGSLLEVGTGFHPELTGRENIFLNGAILGMKKAEIRSKFDEIVAFAEVEKFIDTPVKHYSSGMYVRLAFAVAAHLEPEILIVDEVLAVGDQRFQEKCLGKIGEVAKEGRTVIVVSHSMASISTLCQDAILLKQGFLDFKGPVQHTIERYLTDFRPSRSTVDLSERRQNRSGSGEVRAIAARLLDAGGCELKRMNCGDDLTIDLTLEGSKFDGLCCYVVVKTTTGIRVLHVPGVLGAADTPADCRLRVSCTIPACRLYPGRYVVSIWIGHGPHSEVDWVEDILTFDVEQGALAEYGFDMSWYHGLYFCDSVWSVNARVPPEEMSPKAVLQAASSE